MYRARLRDVSFAREPSANVRMYPLPFCLLCLVQYYDTELFHYSHCCYTLFSLVNLPFNLPCMYFPF